MGSSRDNLSLLRRQGETSMIRSVLLVSIVAAAGANAQIAPLGNLTNGATQVGTVSSASTTTSPSLWDWWIFQANAGDSITIEVDRLVAALDPVSAAWQGNATGAAFGNFVDIFSSGAGFPQVGFGDDEDPAFVPGGPWADPLYGFVAPTTGWYTVAVSSFASNPPPQEGYRYQITVTGSTVPAPAGMAALGLLGLVVARRRR